MSEHAQYYPYWDRFIVEARAFGVIVIALLIVIAVLIYRKG
jgi:hypothetical protein